MDDEPHFGEGEPFSLGVEEELFLVDAGNGRLVNDGPEVLEQLGQVERGEVKSELHRSQIELITGVCRTVGEAVAELCELRRAVLGTGVGLLGAGTHPTAVEGDSIVTENRRYKRIEHLLGDAGATPVCAVHIHVGMPDAETAIRVFNGLRRHLPLLEALGANSPFRHGRDTGLASARELTLRSWPRSGVPRALADYADFTRSTQRLTRVADVPDYTYHWWKLRPHPRLGTVEIRALDAQVSPRHTAAVVATVHALARYEAQADPSRDRRRRSSTRPRSARPRGRRRDAARWRRQVAAGHRDGVRDRRARGPGRARAAVRDRARRRRSARRSRRRGGRPAQRIPRRRHRGRARRRRRASRRLA